jgi:hypothetical protein
MSATEIIEQIKKLPREEQQIVVAFIHDAEDVGMLQKPGPKVTGEFQRAADEVFTTNAELFRKLAQ